MASNSKNLSEKDFHQKHLKKSKSKKKKSTSSRDETAKVQNRVDVYRNEREYVLESRNDAPVIDALNDERPRDIRSVEEFQKTDRWKLSSDTAGKAVSQKYEKSRDEKSSSGKRILHAKRRENDDFSPPRRTDTLNRHDRQPAASPRKNRPADRSGRDDLPPPRDDRRNNGHIESNLSPRRSRYDEKYRDDLPLPLKGQTNDGRPHDDLPPPRRNQQSERYAQDNSPSRRIRKDDKYSKDFSPPRRTRPLDDSSPPREIRRTGRYDQNDLPPPRKGDRFDEYPPSHRSPVRHNRSEKHIRDDFPSRKGQDMDRYLRDDQNKVEKRFMSDDRSPRGNYRSEKRVRNDLSPPRKDRPPFVDSPPRRGWSPERCRQKDTSPGRNSVTLPWKKRQPVIDTSPRLHSIDRYRQRDASPYRDKRGKPLEYLSPPKSRRPDELSLRSRRPDRYFQDEQPVVLENQRPNRASRLEKSQRRRPTSQYEDRLKKRSLSPPRYIQDRVSPRRRLLSPPGRERRRIDDFPETTAIKRERYIDDYRKDNLLPQQKYSNSDKYAENEPPVKRKANRSERHERSISPKRRRKYSFDVLPPPSPPLQKRLSDDSRQKNKVKVKRDRESEYDWKKERTRAKDLLPPEQFQLAKTAKDTKDNRGPSRKQEAQREEFSPPVRQIHFKRKRVDSSPSRRVSSDRQDKKPEIRSYITSPPRSSRVDRHLEDEQFLQKNRRTEKFMSESMSPRRVRSPPPKSRLSPPRRRRRSEDFSPPRHVSKSDGTAPKDSFPRHGGNKSPREHPRLAQAERVREKPKNDFYETSKPLASYQTRVSRSVSTKSFRNDTGTSASWGRSK